MREDSVLVWVALVHGAFPVVVPPVRVGVGVIAVRDAEHLRTRGIAEASWHTTSAGETLAVAVAVVVLAEVLADVAYPVSVQVALVGVGDGDAVVAAVEPTIVVVVRALVVVPPVRAGVRGVGVAVAVAIGPCLGHAVDQHADVAVVAVDLGTGRFAFRRGVPGADHDLGLRGGLDHHLLVVDRRWDTELVLLAEVTPHEERGDGEEADERGEGTHGIPFQGSCGRVGYRWWVALYILYTPYI